MPLLVELKEPRSRLDELLTVRMLGRYLPAAPPVDCRACGGEGYFCCSACHGSGGIHDAPCGWCGGYGNVETCGECKGTGHQPTKIGEP